MKRPEYSPADDSVLHRINQELARVGSLGPRGTRALPEGTEFLITTVTESGMHQVVAVDARRRGGSGPSEATPDEQVELRSVVRALLDMAGHGAGTVRTSVVLLPEGPRVVACTGLVPAPPKP
ncbi:MULTISPECIES: hypothetical protein [unclassified Streptomyces]|uniref:hypothetical protein n=1 Tax=unclassified Streptomyces TaxID=2593676 RepID=UPI00104DDFB6